MNEKRLLLVFSLIVILTVSSCKKKEDFKITEDWITESIPGSRVSAAYMKIENLMEHDDRLLSVASENFEIVEFHNLITEDGLTKMVPVESVAIAGGKSVSFEPGGMHMMMINNKKMLKSGDKDALTLHFEKMGDKKLVITVKNIQEQVK